MDRHNPSAQLLQLSLEPSRIACSFCALVTLLALCALVMTAWPLPWRIVSGVAVLVWGWREARKTRQAGIRALQYADSSWLVILPAGEQWKVARMEPVLVTSWLVLLRVYSEAGERIDLLLWPDSAQADSLRRLRVLLRQLDAR